MKLLDTVAVVGYLNPKDKEHKRSRQYMSMASLGDNDIFVPNTSLLEADLLMKIRGYTNSEREISWRSLESKVPTSQILPNSISSIYSALEFQEKGLDYFDSLITSLALESKSNVITTDDAIGKFVDTEW